MNLLTELKGNGIASIKVAFTTGLKSCSPITATTLRGAG